MQSGRLPLARRAPSLFGALPSELAGLGNDPGHLFGLAQRPSTWRGGAPALGAAPASRLGARFDVAPPEILTRTEAADGATKFALRLADGAVVEAVHMPRAVATPRVTLCLSSQVGCAMACTFCATGTMGLVRNLEAGEIVGQALVMLDALGPRAHGLTSIVLMGMGEPLHNPREVARALEVLAHPRGLGVPALRMTLSTSGLAPQLSLMASWPVRPRLAVSLNATTDAARQRMMPVAGRHELAALFDAVRALPARPGERVTLEYVLLRGENDAAEDAARLAALARGVPHVVNVIPFNPWPGAPHAAPTEAAARGFVGALRALGCFATLRRTRGLDVRGACGQLARGAVDGDRCPQVAARDGAPPNPTIRA